MDWTMVAASVIGAWAMLSVLSGERMTRAGQIAAALAAAKKTGEQPSK
jgi:hypothetical protein